MSDRFMRQADLVPRQRLCEEHVTVIGVGAIGRQVALQLASIGVSRLTLIDFDHVTETNITTQGFTLREVGASKVRATRRAVLEIDPTIQVETIEDRFRAKYSISDSVFCCVDSISAREAMWRCLRSRVRFFSDARMRGEILRILTATELAGHEHYRSTLFPQAEAEAGACTARSTVYAAAIAAGLMLHQFTRWLRSIPCEKDMVLSLLAAELTPS